MNWLIIIKGCDSKGNCFKISNLDNKKQYIVDFGVHPQTYGGTLILTHHHCDHNKYLPRKKDNKKVLFGEETEDVKCWKIPHAGVDCYAYLLEKDLFYMTDCATPECCEGLDLSEVSVVVMELNHSENISWDEMKHSEGGKEHLSHLEVLKFLKDHKVKHDTPIIFTHRSHDNSRDDAIWEVTSEYYNSVLAENNMILTIKDREIAISGRK